MCVFYFLVCVHAFITSVDRAIRLTNAKTPVSAGKVFVCVLILSVILMANTTYTP